MVGDFYGTRIEIWAGFGPVGITEKKHLGIFGGRFLEVLMVKKIKLKHCSFRTKKLHKMKLIVLYIG